MTVISLLRRRLNSPNDVGVYPETMEFFQCGGGCAVYGENKFRIPYRGVQKHAMFRITQYWDAEPTRPAQSQWAIYQQRSLDTKP